MDRYQVFMTMGKSGYSYSDSTDKSGATASVSNAPILEASFDQFYQFMVQNKYPITLPIHFKIYDEDIVTSKDQCMLRYQFLKFLSRYSNASFDFYLSDSSLPAYVTFMDHMKWKCDFKTNYHMTIDRNPVSYKKIPLYLAKGTIDIPEDKLIWFSDKTLRLLPGKISGLKLEDTKKLKKYIHSFSEEVRRKYRLDEMSDFDKAYLVYHYLFDPRYLRNIDLQPLGIGFATRQTYKDRDGVQRLKPSISRWESRPVGTLEHRKGVCAGQARLFSSILCSPEFQVDASPIYGAIPTGEIHCWSNLTIQNKIYQCCTTMKGLFSNLDLYGYQAFDNQYYTRLYPHSSLTFGQVESVKNHVKSLRK